jgi:hypothetical protein
LYKNTIFSDLLNRTSCRQSNLQKGDRIIWLSEENGDNKSHSGMLKWIGHLPGTPKINDIYAGVEFV